jgi:23S rRNA (guanosine2251-2'-O)-methyltransferase
VIQPRAHSSCVVADVETPNGTHAGFVPKGPHIVYGRRPVAEAKRGRRRVLGVVTLNDASADELTRLAGSPDHQGIVAEVEPYPYAAADDMLAAPDALVVALDQVQDPHNLGAVCRSAEAAGATGVVIPDRRSVAVTPAVCKASAGAVEHLAVARVRNLADWLEAAKQKEGLWIYGAAADGAEPYSALDLTGPVVLVLGSEGKGLRPRVASACDALVSIPMRGRAASLNVSNAAAVILFEAVRQRHG